MEERFLTIVDFWKILRRRFKEIFTFVFIIGIISVIISLLLPKWYKASASILPPVSEAGGIGALGMISNLNIPSLMIGNEDYSRYLAILKSRTLATKVIKKFDLQKRYKKDTFIETLENFQDNVEIIVGEEMQIEISVYDKDQELVDDIAQYIVDCLDSINISLNIESASNNRHFIQSRLTEVLDSLKLMETELTTLMKSEGILSLPDQVRVGVEKAAELRTSLTYKEIEYDVARKTVGENAPEAKVVRYEIESLKKKYKEFQDGFDMLLPKFSNIPKLAVDLERIQRQIEYYTRLIEYLGPQYEQAKIEEIKDIPTIQILDHPVRPEKKAKPRRMILVLLSCFIGGFFISCYYLIRDAGSYLKE